MYMFILLFMYLIFYIKVIRFKIFFYLFYTK